MKKLFQFVIFIGLLLGVRSIKPTPQKINNTKMQRSETLRELIIKAKQEKSNFGFKYLVVTRGLFVPPKELEESCILSASVTGALFWLTNQKWKFEEIWLDPEVPFDIGDQAPSPIGGMEDGRSLCVYLEENHFKFSNLKRIRVLTSNPSLIQYMRQSLGKHFKLCLNYPQNMVFSSQEKLK